MTEEEEFTDKAKDPPLIQLLTEDTVLDDDRDCPRVSLSEAGEKQVEGDYCLHMKVVNMEEHITKEVYQVAENRMRCTLECLVSGERAWCWMFGQYSDHMVDMGLVNNDKIILYNPTVLKTKLKYKQVLPEGMSMWTIHCLTRERKPVTFVRSSQGSQSQSQDEMELVVNHGNDERAAYDNHVNAVNVEESVDDPDDNQPTTSTQSASQIEPPLVSQPSLSPIKTPSKVQARPLAPPPAPQGSPQKPDRLYTMLAECCMNKQKYNVMAVVSEVVELPKKRKSKFVARLTITDESLLVAGDLRTSFKFDVLTDLMYQMPEFRVGSVLRIHHMVVEVFNGVADGRVYSGGCVTTVDGEVGRPIEPLCPAARGTGKDIAWTEENDRRVEQLRELRLTSGVHRRHGAITAEQRLVSDITDQGVSRVVARVLAVFTCPGHVILRLEDGTVSRIVSVEWRGEDTETMEQAGDNKYWVDVWCPRDTGSAPLTTGDIVSVDQLECVLEQQDTDTPVFRLQSRLCNVVKLSDNNAEAVEVIQRIRLKEADNTSWNDSRVDRLIAAIANQSETRSSISQSQSFSGPSSQSKPLLDSSTILSKSFSIAPRRSLSQDRTLANSQSLLKNLQVSSMSQRSSSQESVNLLDRSQSDEETPNKCGVKRKHDFPVSPFESPAKKLRRSTSPIPSSPILIQSKDIPRSSPVVSSYSLRSRSQTPPSDPDIKKTQDNIKASEPSVERARSESPGPSPFPIQYSLRSRRAYTPPSSRVNRKKKSKSKQVEIVKEQSDLEKIVEKPIPAKESSTDSPAESVKTITSPPQSPLSIDLQSLPCSDMTEFLANDDPVTKRSSKQQSVSSRSSKIVKSNSSQRSGSSVSTCYESCVGSPQNEDQTQCQLLQDIEEIEVSEGEEGSMYSMHSDSDFEMTMRQRHGPQSPGDMSQSLLAEWMTDDEDNDVETSVVSRTVSQHRAQLRVTCLPACGTWPRITCADVSGLEPGQYRLLCRVVSVNSSHSDIVRGFCVTCGKLDTRDKFATRDGQLYCCSPVPVEERYHVVMTVSDAEQDQCCHVTVSGSQVVTMMGGHNVSDFSAVLQSLEGCLVELGVEKIGPSACLMVTNSQLSVNE